MPLSCLQNFVPLRLYKSARDAATTDTEDYGSKHVGQVDCRIHRFGTGRHVPMGSLSGTLHIMAGRHTDSQRGRLFPVGMAQQNGTWQRDGAYAADDGLLRRLHHLFHLHQREPANVAHRPVASPRTLCRWQPRTGVVCRRTGI